MNDEFGKFMLRDLSASPVYKSAEDLLLGEVAFLKWSIAKRPGLTEF